MALSTHDDYLPMIDLFLGSWEGADAAAVAGPSGSPVVVLEGVDRAGLLALRGALAAKRGEVRHEDLSQRLAAGQVRLHRVSLLGWLGLFNEAARAWWGKVPAGLAVPRVLSLSAALDKFLRPVRDALRLWARLDAGVAPSGVTLPLTVGGEGTFGRVEMQALHDAALAARDEMEGAEFLLTILRGERDALEGRVRAVLSAYLRAVPARLGGEHAVVRSLPRLWPLPGHTPAAVKVSGGWSPEVGAARLTWEASADPKLAYYQVRWCRGEVYNKQEERVAGTVAKEAERVWLAREGLAGPGDAGCYKVYVVLESENERGSAAVTVRREG